MKKRGQYVSFAAGLPLADIFLSVYLLLFLVQIVYSLFDGDVVSTQTNSIDVVMRTSAAMVFGYFISGAFEKSDGAGAVGAYSQSVRKTLASNLDKKKETVRIGVSNVLQSGIQEKKNTNSVENYVGTGNVLRLCVVAFVGIACLAVLIAVRNVDPTGENTASLTQIRDMLSSSIGFLIGGRKQV